MSNKNLVTNLFVDPVTAAAGAALAGTSGAVQVGTWLASEFAKVGRNFAGTPGELSAAALGAGTGAMTGFFFGSVLGALSRQDMVTYFLGNLPGGQAAAGAVERATSLAEGSTSAAYPTK